MAFRFSKRPHKQFLWFLIRRDSRLSKGKKVGLDAGCANMKNRPFFETESYIGLDPDPVMLEKGKEKVKESITYNCTILEAPNIQADFVHCIQVFVNSDFDKKEALDVTQKLVSMINPGGVLLINTGKMTIQYDDTIREVLESAFEHVTVVRYGNVIAKDVPILFALIIALGMYLFPFVRLIGGHKKTYFRCFGKRS